MIIKDKKYGEFSVWLVDDGTLDTVISVNLHNSKYIIDELTKEIRFSQEYATDFRDDTGALTDKGYNQLANEAIEAYIEQYLI